MANAMLVTSVLLLAASSVVLAECPAAVAAVTTRYWDCCKPSCAWPGKASFASPVKTCSASGSAIPDQNAVNGCDGGTAFMCAESAPLVISSTLAYATAAVALAGTTESDTCCACYKLVFTDDPVKDQILIVQSINTGSDVGSNQFDIAIPGGGAGIFTTGCPAQFGVSANNFGAQYGGIGTESDCNNLPSALQEGCRFRFGWMKGANNPAATFLRVACPDVLVSRTGCLRAEEQTCTLSRGPRLGT